MLFRSITVKEFPGGSIIYSYSGILSDAPEGMYEYLFLQPRFNSKLILRNLPSRPNPEVTITLTNGAGNPVGIGLINMGSYQSLAGVFGATKYGATAEPISNSYIKVNPDGTVVIVRRSSATNMRASVQMEIAQADKALAIIQNVLDVPVSFIGSDVAGYAGLNVFGLGSATVSYDNPGFGTVNVTVKGMI